MKRIKWNIEKVKQYTKENTKCKVLSNEYINNKSNLLFKCHCGDEFESTWVTFTRSSRMCNRCAFTQTHVRTNKKKKTHQQFIKEVFELVGSEYTVLSKYSTARIKVKIKHNVCGQEYEVLPAKFTSTGRRCPYCSNSTIKTNETFENEVKALVQDEYTFLERYVNANTDIEVKHNACGNIYSVRPHDFINGGNRCPHCNESRGEKEVSKILSSLGVGFETEVRFKDCRNIRPLPFDFYAKSLNLAIEYDGELHFKPARFSDKETMKQKLKEQQINDETKNRYCKENNIKLLRIPYWEFDNIEKILKSVLP